MQNRPGRALSLPCKEGRSYREFFRDGFAFSSVRKAPSLRQPTQFLQLGVLPRTRGGLALTDGDDVSTHTNIPLTTFLDAPPWTMSVGHRIGGRPSLSRIFVRVGNSYCGSGYILSAILLCLDDLLSSVQLVLYKCSQTSGC